MDTSAPPYPGEARFAFTILDDTDDATVENVAPLYYLLHELGFRTTKTVWPVDCPEGSRIFFAGKTMADPEYRDFCLDLDARGFEVTWHCATMESSERARTIAGLEAFREFFGRYPTLHANHGGNRENCYWGHKRYQIGALRLLARRMGKDLGFEGENPDSKYFWGDLCKEHFQFVRNFTYYNINTLAVDSHFPYRLSATPYVNYWFSTSDAADVDQFNRLVTRESIDRLNEEGGICILSTHLGKGFVQDGRVDPQVEDTLRYIASLPSWLPPVSEILEYRLANGAGKEISRIEHARLELAHVIDRLRGV